MPNAVVGGGQRPHGAAAKLQRVGLEIVIVEDAPGPADHGVGVQVRQIGERKLGGRPVPFSAVEVPPPLPIPGATVLIEAWAYAP